MVAAAAAEWFENEDLWRAVHSRLFGARQWESAVQEVDAMLELLAVEPPAAVLDLCCGPGRHSIELARRGFTVTGVDRTARYLEEGRRRAASDGLPLELVRADMREFRRPDSFDAAISWFTSLGYMQSDDEERDVLANVHQSLRRGGRILIDTLGREIVTRSFQPRSWEEIGDVVWLEERTLIDEGRRIEFRWICLAGGEREEFRILLRVFSDDELAALLRDCGFDSIEIYGDSSGAPYDAAAERLVVLARK